MTDERRKQIHINLVGDQIDDYEIVQAVTGITNDNDLVRHLFRMAASRARAETEWSVALMIVRKLREGSITEREADIVLGLVSPDAVADGEAAYAGYPNLAVQDRVLVDAVEA